MPRAGLTPAAVVDRAVELVDEQGPEALTLAAVAGRAGVATPSLYKHVTGGLAELRRLIAVRVTDELTERLSRAVLGRGGDEALAALIDAYVEYAVQYPHRYAALPQAPQDDPASTAAAGRLVEVILAVLRGYGLAGSELIHATRTVRAAAHGFASLSTAGGFRLAEDVATTRQRLTGVLVAGLRDWPR
ncbi:TetR/AcrR family transcriptional regulator [Kitasatospora sp. DSM 101779]|jgi:AcrR family transcriptional regulator|uniref:TetR/AcrR family transcriptional regulator n=1 Tax=Kitasatospora sp. DSM 101779 TaxID=2853165 RepID=UPI0021D99F0B|nr:TetR-like C-terminal domain-containing protein [Kitasatospora sp. DSM 101779]MCU7823458.1 WHG domain-containing protein [Kitasatospora sp. DSM 101779]